MCFLSWETGLLIDRCIINNYMSNPTIVPTNNTVQYGFNSAIIHLSARHLFRNNIPVTVTADSWVLYSDASITIQKLIRLPLGGSHQAK